MLLESIYRINTIVFVWLYIQMVKYQLKQKLNKKN